MTETKCPECKAIVYKDSIGNLNDFIGHDFVLGGAVYKSHECKNLSGSSNKLVDGKTKTTSPRTLKNLRGGGLVGMLKGIFYVLMIRVHLFIGECINIPSLPPPYLVVSYLASSLDPLVSPVFTSEQVGWVRGSGERFCYYLYFASYPFPPSIRN